MTYVGHLTRLADPDQLFTDLLETRVSADQPYYVGWEQFVSVGVKSCSSSQRTLVLYVAF